MLKHKYKGNISNSKKSILNQTIKRYSSCIGIIIKKKNYPESVEQNV